MSTPSEIFMNGVYQAAGTYVGAKYVAPAADAAIRATAEKTVEAAHHRGNAALSGSLCAAGGGAIAGPPGALVGWMIGWESGKESDIKANEKYEAGEEDGRCSIQ